MKRFTDTEKWFDEWFRKLPTDYKIFWNFLCDRCNNAGIWKEDVELANIVMFGRDQTGINMAQAQALFGDRITPLRIGYWFIRGFVYFQFGELSPNNRMHASVLELLRKEGAYKGLLRPQGIIGKGKVRTKEGGMGETEFEAVWKDYPRKLGKDEAKVHFLAQVKTPKDIEAIQKALVNFNGDIKAKRTGEEYIPHGSTWFNKRWKDWVDYKGAELPHAPQIIRTPLGCQHAKLPKVPGETTECPDCAAEFYTPKPNEFMNMLKAKGMSQGS